MKKIYFLSLIFTMLMFSDCQAQPSSVKLLTPAAFKEAIKSQNIQLVDVRTPNEFGKGHIEGAKNIDYYASNFKEEINKLNKDTPIYIYCAVGGRSKVAASMLLKMGFKDVNDLSGGFIAWKKMQ